MVPGGPPWAAQHTLRCLRYAEHNRKQGLLRVLVAALIAPALKVIDWNLSTGST